MKIDVNDFEEKEFNVNDSYTYYYITTFSKEKVEKYFPQIYPDYTIDSYSAETGIQAENIGIEIGLMIDKETGKIDSFNCGIAAKDNDGNINYGNNKNLVFSQELIDSYSLEASVLDAIAMVGYVTPHDTFFIEKVKVVNMSDEQLAIEFEDFAAEEMSNILMDEDVKTFKMAEDLIRLYDQNGDFGRKCIDDTLRILTNKDLKEIITDIADFVKKSVPGYIEVTKRDDSIRDLAVELDDFSYALDFYEYSDQVDDRAAHISTIMHDISKGNVSSYINYLQEYVDEGAGVTEHLAHAKKLIYDLKKYDTNATKIEEPQMTTIRHRGR